MRCAGWNSGCVMAYHFVAPVALVSVGFYCSRMASHHLFRIKHFHCWRLPGREASRGGHKDTSVRYFSSWLYRTFHLQLSLRQHPKTLSGLDILDSGLDWHFSANLLCKTSSNQFGRTEKKVGEFAPGSIDWLNKHSWPDDPEQKMQQCLHSGWIFTMQILQIVVGWERINWMSTLFSQGIAHIFFFC